MTTPPETDPETSAILDWWRRLYPDADTKMRGDAGARAAMRRADTPLEALLQPACHELLKLLRDRGVHPGRLSDAHLKRIAMAASLLCHRQDVRTGGQSFTAALGPRADGERALLAPLRFQSLMAAIHRADDAEQMKALRRALALAKDAPFNITGFVRDLLHFSDQTRIRWTFDYYGAARETQPVEPISEAEETRS